MFQGLQEDVYTIFFVIFLDYVLPPYAELMVVGLLGTAGADAVVVAVVVVLVILAVDVVTGVTPLLLLLTSQGFGGDGMLK